MIDEMHSIYFFVSRKLTNTIMNNKKMCLLSFSTKLEDHLSKDNLYYIDEGKLLAITKNDRCNIHEYDKFLNITKYEKNVTLMLMESIYSLKDCRYINSKIDDWVTTFYANIIFTRVHMFDIYASKDDVVLVGRRDGGTVIMAHAGEHDACICSGDDRSLAPGYYKRVITLVQDMFVSHGNIMGGRSVFTKEVFKGHEMISGKYTKIANDDVIAGIRHIIKPVRRIYDDAPSDVLIVCAE